MTIKAKFLFDRSFDEPLADQEIRPLPGFSAADVEAARQQGLAEGRKLGGEAARGAFEKEMLEAMRAVESGLAEVMRQQGAGIAALRETAARLGLAVGRKLSANFARMAPAAEVEAVILRCIDEQRDEPRLVVRASDAVIEALRPGVDAFAARGGYEGQIVLLPDEGAGPGDCRIEWADGGAVRDENALAERIAEIVMREARSGAV